MLYTLGVFVWDAKIKTYGLKTAIPCSGIRVFMKIQIVYRLGLYNLDIETLAELQPAKNLFSG